MKPELSNRAIAELLERHARLLEIAGESPFRTRAYSRAAESIRSHGSRVSTTTSSDELRAIPGVGEGIAAAIADLIETGNFTGHDELTRQFPESLLGLTSIPGIGAKTANKLFAMLGVDSVAALDAALASGTIAKTRGLGSRTETVVREGLASFHLRTGRTPLGVALPIARDFIAAYSLHRPNDEISLAGSARRWQVTVGDLNFVVASKDARSAFHALSDSTLVKHPAWDDEHVLRFQLEGELPATVRFTEPTSWGTTLVRATGNSEHLARLGAIPDHAETELEIYAAKGLPWIPPELRTGSEEFVRWAEIASLVQLSKINGEFHAHTTWSDGGGSVEAMASAAADRGYEFLGITDHSHGLGVAGGLDSARLMAQRIELDAFNEMAGIRLLAGAEVEVHRDGSLDYDDQTLAGLDVVVASLHTGLRQPQAQLTARLITVLENRNVDIIAHPSGRLIERREGGDFDWDQVFATAARTGTALEINADPARLDLDPSLAQRASSAGCLITVNCDAHSPAGFGVMEYGLAMARRAWLRPEKILNCWTRAQVIDWLSARGRPI